MVSRTPILSVTKKDLVLQFFRAGGKGGQHQNKTSSGVRIVHRDSGAVGESRQERSQAQNKKIAFKRLADSVKFKLWLNRRVFEIEKLSKTIDEQVAADMMPENLLIEVGVGGR
jgi:protein subunit release factor B